MSESSFDCAVVGAGIVGLAHAYLAARAGKRVVVLERNPAASGASVRNFGMIWPIGQPPGKMLQLSLRSRDLWIELLEEAGLPYLATGSLHAAYREDEAAVGREFAEQAPELGYRCKWLEAEHALQRSQALQPGGLIGALWSDTELTVDPRQVIRELPRFLRARYGVEFCFNTEVHALEPTVVQSGEANWRAQQIIVASGDDFQGLYATDFAHFDLTRCKLQMLRTVPQPGNWQLGPSLAFGLTFRHYPTFHICPSLPALKERVARETPEFDRWGIHIMASQTMAGELTLGDSHEYGLAVDIFDKPLINRLILDYAAKHMQAPSFEIAELWHGVYAKHPSLPYIRFSPQPGIQVVVVTSGIGMTLSLGLAEETFCQMAAEATCS